MALERGLVPDDTTIKQLAAEQESPFAGDSVASLRWPEDPLRSVLISKAPWTRTMLAVLHSTYAQNILACQHTSAWVCRCLSWPSSNNGQTSGLRALLSIIARVWWTRVCWTASTGMCMQGCSLSLV